MALNKDHAIGSAVVAVSMALGAGLTRGGGPTAPPPAALASAPAMTAPPPPSQCKQRCDSLPPGCLHVVNCVALLTDYEHEGRLSCDAPLSQQTIDWLGWCPDGGAP